MPTLDLLSLLVESRQGIESILLAPDGFYPIVRQLEVSESQDVQQRTASVLAIVLAQDQYWAKLMQLHPELPNILLQNCATSVYSQPALEALLHCLIQATKRVEATKRLKEGYVGMLKRLAQITPSEEVRRLA